MFVKKQSAEDTAGPTKAALEELIQLAARLNRQSDAAEIVRIITEQAAGLLKAEHAFLFLLNPRTRETLRTVNRQTDKEGDTLLHDIETYTSGWIVRYSQSLLSPDLARDKRFKGIKFRGNATASAIGIPLMSESLIMGSLVLIDKAGGGAYQQDDLDLLERLGQIVAPFMRSPQNYQIFFDNPLPDSVLLEKYAKLGLIGKHYTFIQLLKGIEAAAACDVRVLLQGASGTGKELVARAIHKMSDRWGAPFIAIDCGAIPPSLVESELLGHVKGAFTGASADRKGLFAAADHGTLFMDEVVNLPMEMQSKLLRVLQEGEIRPIGSNKSQIIDVRIITAASSSLEQRVEAGQFREDLYYRLYVFPLIIPSLQERQEDIGLLAGHFLKKFSEKQNKQLQSFHPGIIDYLKRRQWPGNIRELENVVERMVALCPRDLSQLPRSCLPAEMQKEVAEDYLPEEEWNVDQSLAEKVTAYEARLIRRALAENGWNQSRAARALKIPVQTLHYKMEKMKIKKDK